MFAVAWVPCATGAAVQPVRIDVERLAHPQVEAGSLSLVFAPAAGETPPSLRLRADTLRIAALQQRLCDVTFECVLEAVGVSAASPVPAQPAPADGGPPAGVSGSPAAADAAALPVPAQATPGEGPDHTPARQWRCEGPLRWRGGATNWRLSWRADERLGAATVAIAQGRSEIEIELPLSGSPLAMEARRVAVAWLQPFVPQVNWQAGRIDGRVVQGAGDRWRGRLRARELSAEAVAAPVALAGLDLTLPVDLTLGAGGRLHLTTAATLSAGELLAGPVYIGWPQGSEVALELAGSRAGQTWRIERFGLREPGIDLAMTGTLDTSGSGGLHELGIEATMDLSSRYERYLDAYMASLGHGGLVAGGRVQARVELGTDASLQQLQARLDDVSLRHPEGRYALQGIDGTLAFAGTGTGEASLPIDLGWRRLSLHALTFGAGRLQAQARGGAIHAQPVTLEGLKGQVIARDLVLRPQAQGGNLLQASVELDDIDIAELSAAFGWPRFGGRLDGRFPSLSYAGDTLAVGGEIAVQAFDGEVRVQGLTVERPFGVAPALAGEVRIDNLDLVPMTEVFGLGRIEGRLNGHVGGLRLLDWRPTAFDARLETGDRGRRRISQLAVEQLTQIGGGGGTAGLQGRLLGVFDSFGYRKIALSCRLANDVCQMGGIDDAAGGYTILQGSGLPLITIRGFERRVDWPVLVARLQSVASGQRPVVD